MRTVGALIATLICPQTISVAGTIIIHLMHPEHSGEAFSCFSNVSVTHRPGFIAIQHHRLHSITMAGT